MYFVATTLETANMYFVTTTLLQHLRETNLKQQNHLCSNKNTPLFLLLLFSSKLCKIEYFSLQKKKEKRKKERKDASFVAAVTAKLPSLHLQKNWLQSACLKSVFAGASVHSAMPAFCRFNSLLWHRPTMMAMGPEQLQHALHTQKPSFS